MATSSPLRIRYTRIEPGWQKAAVFGLYTTALHFDLARSMDDTPGWVLGAATGPAEKQAADFLEQAALREVAPTLRLLKKRLEEAARNQRLSGVAKWEEDAKGGES